MTNKETKWQIKNGNGIPWAVSFNSKEEAELFYSQAMFRNNNNIAGKPHSLVQVVVNKEE